MKARSRRRARETALKILYECEVGGAELEDAIEPAIDAAGLNLELSDYTRLLVRGVADEQEALDMELEQALTKYDLMRLAAIDRNVLRIAAYEIVHLRNIPPKVSVNEAIEIVKKYSTAESGRFVNGVLGKLMQAHQYDVDPEAGEEAAARETPDVEETQTSPDSKEALEATRQGLWRLRSETPAE